MKLFSILPEEFVKSEIYIKSVNTSYYVSESHSTSISFCPQIIAF